MLIRVELIHWTYSGFVKFVDSHFRRDMSSSPPFRPANLGAMVSATEYGAKCMLARWCHRATYVYSVEVVPS